MAYVQFAKSGRFYSLNDDVWEVQLMRNNVPQATDYVFEVGPAGIQVIYESPEDDILVPGIVHSRCEVETIWPSDMNTVLEAMIDNMVDTDDSRWFMNIKRNNNQYWFGPILIDEVTLQETSAARSCRIVATDGISLLKTVDYNNNGAEYTTDQIIFDELLTNIQAKWVSYDFAQEIASGADVRLFVIDDMYSEDIYTISTEPPGTGSGLTRKMKISSHMLSYTNEDDEIEYLNTYELLDSICKTLLLRLYYYNRGWYFVPCYNTTQSPTGNKLAWSGAYTTGVTVANGFNYQIDTIDNEVQKGNEWNLTFTPPINEVTITRDTNNGQIVLGQTEIAGGSTLNSNSIQFTTGDSGYIVWGNCLVQRSALNPTAAVLDPDRVGRYVLALEIRFGSSPAEYQYYNNTLEAQPQGLFSINLNFSGDGNSAIFVPLHISTGDYSSSAGNFHWHNTYGQNCVFDSNEDSEHHIFWNMEMPAVPENLSGLQITAGIFCFDRDGEFSQTLQNTIISQEWDLYMAYGQGTVHPAPNFDIVANSTFGRGSIDLGKTFLGELHQNVGGIMVETSANVFETSTNWSTVRFDYDDSCNVTGVREVLAAHYKARVVERGNIVMRGDKVAPAPFDIFIDDDTTDKYQCINYRLSTTPAEIEVTLHKVGTDGQSTTTSTTKEYGTSPVPDPGPGLGKGETFSDTFNSGFDFNEDAAERFQQNWSSVFTGETIEGYITYVGPSKGNYFDFQGNTAPTGFQIQRKIYTSDDGLASNIATWHEIHSAYRPKPSNTLRQAIDKINLHTARTTNPDRSFIITYQETAIGFLNDYPNAQAAYSLRKLDGDYTGDAIEVRNNLGQLLDVGFDSNGDLDTAAILTHVGSGNGTIRTWYDQSGNNRDFVQTASSLQPRIATSGVIEEADNGLPAALFANDYMDTSAFAPNPNGAYNFALVSQYDLVNQTQATATGWASSNSSQNYLQQMQSSGKIRWAVRYSDNQLPRPDATNAGSANVVYLQTATFATGTCEAFYNGTQELDKFSQTLNGNPNNASVVHRLGALNTTGTQLVRGYVQEFIIWSNSTAHNAEEISNDMNDYYNAF